jgi:23S rRNA 5-hydroxycytidine C2501 synthase
MKTGRPIEILSPARNLATGRAAIDHGADAVYIGAPKFGARAAAGNSLQDIAALVSYAHKFWARAYVTLNTLLFDDELDEARTMIVRLYEAGVDAVIFQDMGLLELDLPPIPLFASTQTHNYEIEKIKFLESVGIQRVILARELSIQQIAAIRAATAIELEAFIHGALCVSFSGQCYFSEAVKGRSANRGECAQMCRLPYTLKDRRGTVLARNQHVLSLKDLNLSEYLAELINAGVTSFKIEGRLKDADYVKNVTAFYRAKLDAVFTQKKDLRAASSGSTRFSFAPDPSRSFNRGFTRYFAKRRTRDMVSLQTPKSIGATLGRVTLVHPEFFVMDIQMPVHNGDGICFFTAADELHGVNVNRVEGERIYPNAMAGIEVGSVIYRNHDHEFSRVLRGKSSIRKIGVDLVFDVTPDGLILQATDEDGNQATASIAHLLEPAQKPEAARETIRQQASKMGDTDFALTGFTYAPETVFFVPVSVVNKLRRSCLEKLEVFRATAFPRNAHVRVANAIPYPSTTLDPYANVTNAKAAEFYRRHGVAEIRQGVDLQNTFVGTTLMTTKYCLKYQFDLCNGKRGSAEELYLSDGKNTYRVEFDCDRCVMKIIAH